MALFHTNVLDPQIKALPTVSTASGSVANFDTDLTENLIECVCDIQYSQTSGTPTPSNPIPITTYSEMNVTACGYNLLDSSLFYEYSSWKSDLVSGGDFPTSASNRGYKLPVQPNKTYTISFGLDSENIPPYVYLCKTDGTTSTRIAYITSGSAIMNSTYTFTTDNDMYYLRSGSMGSQANFETQIEKISFAQLEFGSRATDYQAFSGNTFTIPFGQTVANGVLDVTTGKLTITHYCYELSENWNWSASGTYSGSMWVRFTDISPIPTNGVCIMSHFETVQTIAQYGAGKCLMDYNALNCWLSVGATLSDWKNYIVTQRTNGTPIQLYAELATPIEIQLDSNQVQALLNENNVWCDTGDTEVKFLLTVGKKIS